MEQTTDDQLSVLIDYQELRRPMRFTGTPSVETIIMDFSHDPNAKLPAFVSIILESPEAVQEAIAVPEGCRLEWELVMRRLLIKDVTQDEFEELAAQAEAAQEAAELPDYAGGADGVSEDC